MARKSNTRAAQGSGTIRKKTVTRKGQQYTYWEGRVTIGNDGTYQEPSKMTVGEWLDIWQKDYLGGVKPFTVQTYSKSVRVHIKPALGAIKLEALTVHRVQGFINDLGKIHGEKKGLSPKTVKCIHGILQDSEKCPRGTPQGAPAGGGCGLSPVQSGGQLCSAPLHPQGD